QSVVSRVANLALVSCACGAVTTAYATTKESHPYVKFPIINKCACKGLEKLEEKLEEKLGRVSTANEYACKGLDKLEEKLPILQQPPERVVAETKELVSSTVSGAVGLVQGGVERTRSALSTGVSTVVGSRVGQLLATGMDTVLGKSEELVERYLPGTDEEPARWFSLRVPTAVADVVVATPARQSRRQSCFVRVGSLSAKLRHQALRISMAELQRARHSAQQVLAQLHRIFELIERGRRGMDGPLYGTQQHLHRMWVEWSRQDAVPMDESEVQGGAMPGRRNITPQVHHCPLVALQVEIRRLAASARGLPSSVQETAGHVRHGMEGVQASLARAHSIHELSDLVLVQSRETVLRAQLSIDELLEYVGQHAPLPWLVGPFAPALVEYPEDVPVEMSKWEGCITVGVVNPIPTGDKVMMDLVMMDLVMMDSLMMDLVMMNL
ncbi:perilipin-3-like, partial [Antrostomus carolinensis]|uniref:perilipin-3-like n=1 Tax=Antrostomus carolinensis TaxID=279965 RepID=UPI0010A9804C